MARAASPQKGQQKNPPMYCKGMGEGEGSEVEHLNQTTEHLSAKKGVGWCPCPLPLALSLMATAI